MTEEIALEIVHILKGISILLAVICIGLGGIGLAIMFGGQKR